MKRFALASFTHIGKLLKEYRRLMSETQTTRNELKQELMNALTTDEQADARAK